MLYYRVIYHDEMNGSDHLEHHGIKGQKWGVRNGPPYPLDQDDKPKSNQTDGFSPLAFYLSAYAAAFAITMIPAAVNSAKEKSQQKKLRKRLFEDEEQPISMQDVKAVNPNYGKEGYRTNCVKCTLALELRARGMDVEAGSNKSMSGLTRKEWEKWFKGAKEMKATMTETGLKKAFSKIPAGARGQFGGTYAIGSGHSIHWTKLKNGEVRFEDAQTNKIWDIASMLEHYRFSEAEPASIYRLDNLKPNLSKIQEQEAYKERTGKKK